MYSTHHSLSFVNIALQLMLLNNIVTESVLFWTRLPLQQLQNRHQRKLHSLLCQKWNKKGTFRQPVNHIYVFLNLNEKKT